MFLFTVEKVLISVFFLLLPILKLYSNMSAFVNVCICLVLVFLQLQEENKRLKATVAQMQHRASEEESRYV